MKFRDNCGGGMKIICKERIFMLKISSEYAIIQL